ncbi:MAG: hypothetical protein OSB19_18685, partial [Opitutaceae bacterium]|nr:hypothetical protein [Opitutaceae bacterium]
MPFFIRLIFGAFLDPVAVEILLNIIPAHCFLDGPPSKSAFCRDIGSTPSANVVGNWVRENIQCFLPQTG